MAAFIASVKREVENESRAAFLKRYLKTHAEETNRCRVQKLQESVDAMRSVSTLTVGSTKSSSTYTQTRQLVALRYLINEGLGLATTDNTHLIRLGHLLSAKRETVKASTGAENFDNSPLKTALSKASNNERPGYLSDLKFVYEVFKSLLEEDAPAIANVVRAIERDILKEEKKRAGKKN